MQSPSIWNRFVSWFDSFGLLALSSFLIIFIPLYPKLPLFEAIPGYIVRVRFEDVMVLLIAGIWFIQALRHKIVWKNSAINWIIAYAIGGMLTIISAVFLTQTIPAEPLHIGKSVLHYFRYLEYFSLVLIVYSSIKTKQHLKWLIGCLLVALLGITIYGVGQKYYYWPVYSTMNREFSKGIRLYLTEHARVQSTFGGHYDLSAFLVIVLPITLAFAFNSKKLWHKIVFHTLHLFGLWLMVSAASRTSFIGYVIAGELVVVWLAASRKLWKEKLSFFISRSAIFGLMVSGLMFFYGEDIYERFLQVLEGYPEYHKVYHTYNAQRKAYTDQALVTLHLKAPSPPANSLSLEEAERLRRVLAASDERPVASRPSDVYTDVPEKVQVATTSAGGITSMITVDKDRTYSENALKYGLSLAIRLDTLWPRAIAGFMKNPILGSGYATLTKESVGQFTEAESTDNNFLRTLGETGLFGFITFYGLIVLVMVKATRYFRSSEFFMRTFSIAVVAGSIGLLFNASYIDVFAASKVAFTYWAVVGIFLAADTLYRLPTSTTDHSSEPIKTPIVTTAHGKKPKRQRA